MRSLCFGSLRLLLPLVWAFGGCASPPSSSSPSTEAADVLCGVWVNSAPIIDARPGDIWMTLSEKKDGVLSTPRTDLFMPITRLRWERRDGYVHVGFDGLDPNGKDDFALAVIVIDDHMACLARGSSQGRVLSFRRPTSDELRLSVAGALGRR